MRSHSAEGSDDDDENTVEDDVSGAFAAAAAAAAIAFYALNDALESLKIEREDVCVCVFVKAGNEVFARATAAKVRNSLISVFALNAAFNCFLSISFCVHCPPVPSHFLLASTSQHVPCSPPHADSDNSPDPGS